MNNTPKQNAFAILDAFVQTMLKTALNNRNFYAIQTKAWKKARTGLTEWGYRLDQANEMPTKVIKTGGSCEKVKNRIFVEANPARSNLLLTSLQCWVYQS